MASRDTPRGVSPVLRGVCANLLWKRSKAALSYSTIKYDAADGDKYITVSSAVPGQAGPFVPHVHETADQYTVILECHTGDAHFYAEYQIPLSDYKGEKEGETVRIKDSWRPIGYEEI